MKILLSGKELKIKRIILDIKASEIAERLGISKAYISLMESGNRRIPKDTYWKWVEILENK